MFDGLTGVAPGEYRGLFLVTALAIMALEFVVARRLNREIHDVSETASSLAIAVGNGFIRASVAGIVAIPFIFVPQHRLFDIPLDKVWALLGLFLGLEFLYYWMHRAAHTVRWLWATHSVHHSPTKLNFTAGIRLGWTGLISGNFLFFLPLVWIGFHPLAVIAMLALNLMYQFFLHTELAPRLGPLEWVFNTPRHHSVHHASNGSCLDKNFSGFLIIFDRLFGTFAVPPKDEPLRYGLTEPLKSQNPLYVVFREWLRMAADLRRARSARDVWRTLFGPPGAVTHNDKGEKS
jgi:sterol desaturase/sphingolipid hydroxylase (fatty acid hydroxylase superfamily)